MNDERDSSKDAERTGEKHAFRRAALRAREIAARTGTPLAIYRDGKVELLPVIEAPAVGDIKSPVKSDS